jgi:hypothetical protein
LSSLTLCFPIGFHFLAYPNLFGIKGFVVVVVVAKFWVNVVSLRWCRMPKLLTFYYLIREI